MIQAVLPFADSLEYQADQDFSVFIKCMVLRV